MMTPQERIANHLEDSRRFKLGPTVTEDSDRTFCVTKEGRRVASGLPNRYAAEEAKREVERAG